MNADQILLGYPEKPSNPALLHRRFFPSKVGGQPAWLNPQHLPPLSDLQCPRCRTPMTFILQVYASLDASSCFHRTIFLFGCQPCGNQFVAMRNQLPRDNAFYPFEPPDTDNVSGVGDEEEDEFKSLLCPVCGLPKGDGEAGSSPDTSPAAKEGRRGDDKAALIPRGHRRCRRVSEDGMLVGVFEEYELEVDEEGEEDADKQGDYSHEMELKRRYDEVAKDNPDATLDESEQQFFEEFAPPSCRNDDTFQTFLKRVRTNPGHVLRYAYEGAPLWFASAQQLEDGPPDCDTCGSPRVFEFQVQPELIHLLKLDKLEWGILAVYTCSANCGGEGYVKEFVYRQPEPM